MKRIAVIIPVMMMLSLSSLLFAQHGNCKMSSSKSTVETVTLKGEITNVLLPLAKFKSENKEYTVHLGPTWYWKQENLKLETGAVEMMGEKEEVNGEWHFYPNKIAQGKVEIVLAENGLRKWENSGRGKGHHGNNRGCGGCCEGGRR
jgi:hypothetical protein